MNDKIARVVTMAMEQFRKEYGEDAHLEDGDEFAVIFNDGVFIVGLEDREIKMKVLMGKPFVVDENMGF